jgi:hypothetical protein
MSLPVYWTDLWGGLARPRSEPGRRTLSAIRASSLVTVVGLASHNANLAPAVEGGPIRLEARHTKVRRDGYRK